MHDNKVSEKAIWEGTITPDESPTTVSQMQTQSQMMFCYKCDQVIPGNSTYCPYCQVKLFTECPNCGAKYSSQYPSCSQCGINREEYLYAKQKEKKAKEAYFAENAMIMETCEYKSLHFLLLKAVKAYIIHYKIKEIFMVVICVGFAMVVYFVILSLARSITLLVFIASVLSLTICLILGALVCSVFMEDSEKKRMKFLSQYISSKNVPDNDMLQYVLKRLYEVPTTDGMLNYLSQWCIEAYRAKMGLPIHHK